MNKPGTNVRYETRTITIDTGIGLDQLQSSRHTMTFKVRIPTLPKISKIVGYVNTTTHRTSVSKSAKNKVKKFKQVDE